MQDWKEKLRNIPGTLNIRDDAAKKTYEYEVNIDSTKASEHGLLKSDIEKQINIALKGYSSSVYRKNGSDYDILVKTNISSVEDLKKETNTDKISDGIISILKAMKK